MSCLSLVYAWRHARGYFPLLLAFVVPLLVSTVYLRHHWVVDLLAGAALVPWVLWVTPRFERWWLARGAAAATAARRATGRARTGSWRAAARPPSLSPSV